MEAGRGCHFKCDFCAVQTVFNSTQTRRPVDEIIAEVQPLRSERKLFFFVDDNITSNIEQAKELGAQVLTAETEPGNLASQAVLRHLGFTSRKAPVEAGDTLWAIAERFYGDGNKYQAIADASSVENPDLIYPGQVLTIP